MPLEDPNVVDVVRIAEDGKVILTIVDAGVTADPSKRFGYFSQKLKVYVSAVMAGHFKAEYPNHAPQDFVIEVACARPPTPQMAEIVQVTSRGDPNNAIPVQYTEYPEGAWSDPVPTEELPKPTGTKAEEILAEDIRLMPVAKAQASGLDVAEVDLKHGTKDFFFAVVGIGEESSIIDFHKKSATDEVLDRAMQYVRDLPMPYTVCVLVTEGEKVKLNGKEQDAVLLMSYMRGEEKGMLFAKPFRRKNMLRKFEWLGPMQFIGSLPNLFSAEQ